MKKEHSDTDRRTDIHCESLSSCPVKVQALTQPFLVRDVIQGLSLQTASLVLSLERLRELTLKQKVICAQSSVSLEPLGTS